MSSLFLGLMYSGLYEARVPEVDTQPSLPTAVEVYTASNSRTLVSNWKSYLAQNTMMTSLFCSNNTSYPVLQEESADKL
jgi:hypothetical protein